MASPDHVPLTKAAAEMYGPYESLVKLYDIIGDQTGETERPCESYLAELALSSAVLTWWEHLQPEVIHHALVCGARLGQISAALGVDELKAYDRWSEWASEQAVSPISKDTYVNEIEDIHRRFGYGGFPDSP